MKKSLIILGIIIAIAGLLFWVLRPQNSQTIEERPIISLKVLEKAVFLEEEGNLKYEVENLATTTIGSRVETGTYGRALIEGGGYKSVLDYNSSLVLEDTGNKSSTSQKLSFGSIWSRVEKVFEQGEFYEIKTQNAVAVVRGTAFALNFQNDVSSLFVVEGSVSFFGLKENGEKDLNTGVTVKAGSKAFIDGKKSAVLLPFDNKDKNTDWYKYLLSGNYPSVQTTPPPIKTLPKAPSVPTSVSNNQNLPNSATNNSTIAASQATSTLNQNQTTQIQATSTFTIDSVSPAQILFGSQDFVDIIGTGLDKTKFVLVGQTPINNPYIVGNGLIRIQVQNIGLGVYDIVLYREDGTIISKKAALTIYREQTPNEKP
ncbi:MAG: FecR family protein [Patescibacteria group bacterium]